MKLCDSYRVRSAWLASFKLTNQSTWMCNVILDVIVIGQFKLCESPISNPALIYKCCRAVSERCSRASRADFCVFLWWFWPFWTVCLFLSFPTWRVLPYFRDVPGKFWFLNGVRFPPPPSGQTTVDNSSERWTRVRNIGSHSFNWPITMLEFLMWFPSLCSDWSI